MVDIVFSNTPEALAKSAPIGDCSRGFTAGIQVDFASPAAKLDNCSIR